MIISESTLVVVMCFLNCLLKTSSFHFDCKIPLQDFGSAFTFSSLLPILILVYHNNFPQFFYYLKTSHKYRRQEKIKKDLTFYKWLELKQKCHELYTNFFNSKIHLIQNFIFSIRKIFIFFDFNALWKKDNTFCISFSK